VVFIVKAGEYIGRWPSQRFERTCTSGIRIAAVAADRTPPSRGEPEGTASGLRGLPGCECIRNGESPPAEPRRIAIVYRLDACVFLWVV
jgi:hypothetical protein